MSDAAMETAEEEAGRATAATREPTKDAEGTNAEALMPHGEGRIRYFVFFAAGSGDWVIVERTSSLRPTMRRMPRKPRGERVKSLRHRETCWHRGAHGGEVGGGRGSDGTKRTKSDSRAGGGKGQLNEGRKVSKGGDKPCHRG